MPSQGNARPVGTSTGGNHLLDGLPPRPRKAVLTQCERVDIDDGTVLCEAGKPFKYVYFPIAGSISLINTLIGYDHLETESIGSEGMLGAVLILGINRAPQCAIAQTPCVALRMKGKSMREALKHHPALHRMLQRYLYVVLSELSQTAGCIHFHEVGNRLARGLLQAHDRSSTDQIPLTHQLLAEMLGVQRGAVTIAAIKLQREGIIRYSRGKISVLDRQRLEDSSCGCYGASVQNYATILS